ncbi:MAG: hypothetical protein NDI73_00735 [Desulfuromonadales bacterium]|nr:hypothetical protein [Desulfuromonadales bacterium]
MKKEHMEVLLEEIRGKFDLILEGHDSLHAKMDGYRLESNEKHDLTALKINALKDRIDSVEEKLTNRIDSVEEKLTNRIDSVEEKLTNRIDSVEQNLTAHIDAVAADLSAHRADTEAHSRYQIRE